MSELVSVIKSTSCRSSCIYDCELCTDGPVNLLDVEIIGALVENFWRIIKRTILTYSRIDSSRKASESCYVVSFWVAEWRVTAIAQ